MSCPIHNVSRFGVNYIPRHPDLDCSCSFFAKRERMTGSEGSEGSEGGKRLKPEAQAEAPAEAPAQPNYLEVIRSNAAMTRVRGWKAAAAKQDPLTPHEVALRNTKLRELAESLKKSKWGTPRRCEELFAYYRIMMNDMQEGELKLMATFIQGRIDVLTQYEHQEKALGRAVTSGGSKSLVGDSILQLLAIKAGDLHTQCLTDVETQLVWKLYRYTYFRLYPIHVTTYRYTYFRLIRMLTGKNSEETLELLKTAWGSWMKEWFNMYPDKREILQSFVYDRLEDAGMKTYDELSGIELLLRRGCVDGHAYATECAKLGIQLVPNERSSAPNFLGGGRWSGTNISFNPAKQNIFHRTNVDLIRGVLTPLQSRNFKHAQTGQTRKHLCVITDPRTDPTEDDAACLMALVNGNRQLNIWDTIDILVTGCKDSLDARYRGIEKLLGLDPRRGVVRIQVAPIEGFGNGRFLAPYGGSDGDMRHVLETAAKADKNKKHNKKHVVDRIPAKTTDLLVIGQVPGNFFHVLKEKNLNKLKGVSVQGPGFNLMGAPGKDDVGEQISKFLDTKACEFYWSDNTSGLMITPDEANERITALGKCLNGDIPKMRSACITSFWATAGKFDQFESQFGGYKYGSHTLPLLRELSAQNIVVGLFGSVNFDFDAGDKLLNVAKKLASGIKEIAESCKVRIYCGSHGDGLSLAAVSANEHSNVELKVVVPEGDVGIADKNKWLRALGVPEDQTEQEHPCIQQYGGTYTKRNLYLGKLLARQAKRVPTVLLAAGGGPGTHTETFGTLSEVVNLESELGYLAVISDGGGISGMGTFKQTLTGTDGISVVAKMPKRRDTTYDRVTIEEALESMTRLAAGTPCGLTNLLDVARVDGNAKQIQLISESWEGGG